ncbi:hypothetical protein EZI54_21645 [Marinobacter halodurans]|uniref:DUF2750 domain-containing protein n=1 Tax=Marinobacter halodurans TaxID=2528979 RepID=A0ABY1ZG10_9GAMM|nr:hypothetical protein [Marinobacter halodurans]TBW48114.1 hypothetical protein EZI54_21645 [Marinobacter halodurans]
MAFVNEFVPEDDVKNYNLDKIWDSYHPNFKGSKPIGFRHSWTVDRERNVFLIWQSSGREEFSNRHTFVLWWKGELLTVILDVCDESFYKLSDNIGKTVWSLFEIEKPDGLGLRDKEIIPVLKEALSVYGYRGAQRQLSDFKVEFKF